jgi:DNA-directed RNA polymerase II subunit RPB2
MSKKSPSNNSPVDIFNISWNIIDKYFKENTYNLVSHHLDSYNEFFNKGIFQVFAENNPFRFLEDVEKIEGKHNRNECLLYLGGKNGTGIYFGKPVIYDDNHIHFMYPNDARLRNMTYGVTIHYDVDVEFIFYEGDTKIERSISLSKMYLGKFPIMLHSNMCVLKGMATNVRFNVGECKNDFGGYFIIDGKEKVIVSQEKFADNMLYIRDYKEGETYSHSAEIRSVSEDTSKPIRTTSVKIIAPSTTYSNNQIVVDIPNVRKPIPLFILMRALGVESDKSIIEFCLLDLEKNKEYIDLFIPSVHDANKVFNQITALEFIKTFTKRQTINSVLDILMNYFLAHVGVTNFIDKAYFVGHMVYKMLRVFKKDDNATDRDNFKFKRVELSGTLIYDLFREYYLTQKRSIELEIDKIYYNDSISYTDNVDDFANLITNNFEKIFKNRVVETGFKKAFKGNWGSMEYTKRVGIVQDLNRLSWNTFISHLRKINLDMDPTSKTIKPRLLNNSQFGYIDILDSPDGGNIGLHKHLSISTTVTTNISNKMLIDWVLKHLNIRLLKECSPQYISIHTKFFVNGRWVGIVESPIEIVNYIKLLRRNGILHPHISICFNYEQNVIYMYSDGGRLTRPIYYIENRVPSFARQDIIKLLDSPLDFSWSELVSGFKKQQLGIVKQESFAPLYDISNMENIDEIKQIFMKNRSVIDYVDLSEEETALIAMDVKQLNNTENMNYLYYTHLEIDPSLLLGVMGNSIIYPEHNPSTRNTYSCGQSKQAVSLYHSNYQMRIDKMGVVLNYGQVPLIKSRYLEYINNEEQPYGINAIVAIMCHTGYNVEDAILINQGAVDRGIFRTSYYSMYESKEEIEQVDGNTVTSSFTNFETKEVTRIKPGYDYSQLDKDGIIKENTPLDDKIVLIGKATHSAIEPNIYVDNSTFPKKGQLGYVDKSFITEGDEGKRLAKIRIREERIPAIGDKMASRAGQKGTLGLLIPECDMPFMEDGTRPDLIINPHAIPSRMTIGQLIECVFGKVCAMYGSFGDCTAFSMNGPNHEIYGKMLINLASENQTLYSDSANIDENVYQKLKTGHGFHSSGNQILYNGTTGEQIISDIFVGPTYYMRLKHMVKDKVNYRARGPNTMMTRQPVQGRANDGGLRIGEMERDALMAHGMTAFLTESFLKRSDEYYMAVCNKTGAIAIYNPTINLFLSPFADGPLKFNETLDGKQVINNISRFGRSFSIVRVPYSFKLMIQELQVMNVQMRIITDSNVEQLMNMSFSNNIKKLLHTDEEDLQKVVESHVEITTNKQIYVYDKSKTRINGEEDEDQTVDAVIVPDLEAQTKEQEILQNLQQMDQEEAETAKPEESALMKLVPDFIKQSSLFASEEKVKEKEELPPGWTKMFSTSKQKDYYFNKSLNKSVWNKSEIPQGELPFGWSKKFSNSKQKDYYYNKSTGETVWTISEIPVVPQGKGVEFEPRDPDELAEGVESLITSENDNDFGSPALNSLFNSLTQDELKHLTGLDKSNKIKVLEQLKVIKENNTNILKVAEPPITEKSEEKEKEKDESESSEGTRKMVIT